MKHPDRVLLLSIEIVQRENARNIQNKGELVYRCLDLHTSKREININLQETVIFLFLYCEGDLRRITFD